MRSTAIHQTSNGGCLPNGGRPTVSFGTMLSQLGDQHQREIEEAVDSWIRENLRLQSLVKDLEAKLQLHENKHPARDAAAQCVSASAFGEEKASTYDTPTKAHNGISSVQKTLPTSLSKQMSDKQISGKISSIRSAPSTALARRVNVSDLQSASLMQIQTITSFVNADKKEHNRSIQRFRALMELDDSVNQVRPEHLVVALTKKAPDSVIHWTSDRLKELIGEFKRISDLLELNPKSEDGSQSSSEDWISIDTFVSVILLPDLSEHVSVQDKRHSRGRPSRRSFFRRGNEETIVDFQRDLLKEDVADVLAELGSRRRSALLGLSNNTSEALLAKLNAFVGCTVVLSLLVLAISLDVAPLSPIWIVAEVLISSVFVLEIIVKIKTFGCDLYFRGPGRYFNMLDMFVTCLSIVDASFSIVALGSRSGSDVSSGRLALIARALRLTRVTRLMKMLEMPILKELATMLLAFVIAIRTLAWMLLLFTVSLFVVGIMVRISVGPSPGQDLLSECPIGDQASIADPPQCKIHYLYGEEFFGTTMMATFSLFRCIMGDCTTKAGKSLSAQFSAGFGIRFDIVYVIGMMIVYFGFFNVINAIFVESVISGLKRNDVRNHYLRCYDTDFVTGKIMELTQRIHTICCPQLISTRMATKFTEEGTGSSIVYTKEDFFNIVNDEVASAILDDLDISRFNRERLFDIFDINGNGTVSEAQFMNTLMQLRGEAQKSDVLQASTMIRSLRSRIDRVHEIVLNNQCQMLQNQRYLLRDIISDSLGDCLPQLLSTLSGQPHAATLARRRVFEL